MTCSIPDCESIAYCRGWCVKHYRRWKRHGDPEKIAYPSLVDRFWNKVDFDGPISDYRPDLGPCWVWNGALTGGPDGGYGSFRITSTKTSPAHRVAYELLIGPIPTDEEAGYRVTLDHLCRNHACVNPGHLEVVPEATNILRGNGAGATNARKTHCPKGHRYNEENTYIVPSTGGRQCLACQGWTPNEGRERRPHRRRRDHSSNGAIRMEAFE